MKTNHSKTILVIILSVIVIAAVAGGIVWLMKNKSEDKQMAASQAKESVVISEDEVSKDRLLKDKYPEVNELIRSYREALTQGDKEALKKIYNTKDEISSDVLSSTSQIIEGYSNTVCYTKQGLEEDSYFVFVYDDLKIRGIRTPAPNLTMVYVKHLSGDDYYIYRGEENRTTGGYAYDAKTESYIQNLYEDEEVQNLVATVYQAKEDACRKDEDLRKFIDGLSSPDADVTEETESETVGETDTSETETSEDEIEG